MTKITFNLGSIPLIAFGIEFTPTAGGSTFRAKATRQAILSAGAIQCPALLQLSGIGDSSIFNPLGIKTLISRVSVGIYQNRA